MKHVIFAAVLSMVMSTFACAEDDSKLIKMRFDRGPQSLGLSAHYIDFSANDPPQDEIGGRSMLPRRCILEGEARMSISDDIVICADRISFRSDGTEAVPSSIKAVGNCKWKDSEYEISADRFEVVGGEKRRFVFSGNVVLVHGGKNPGARLTADSLTVRDGKILGRGDVSFEPIDP